LGRILIGQRENVLTQQRKFHLKGGAAQKKKIETSSWAFVNVLRSTHANDNVLSTPAQCWYFRNLELSIEQLSLK
jgi:hypothetical protein